MDAETVERLIDAQGFDHRASFDPKGLRIRKDVRAGCSPTQCRYYGKNWVCPPACAELEEYERELHGFSRGIVFQSVAKLKSVMDWTGMKDALVNHDVRVYALAEQLAAEYGAERYMVLAGDACALCDTCTYPDEPCRHPDRCLLPMEAVGLNVIETSTLANLRYNYGEEFIASTSCVLFD